jgi:hypothetical protein
MWTFPPATGSTRSEAAGSGHEGDADIAEDAAHVHSPVGGQGLNIGLQDAVNLGWKLAQVVKGISPDRLLDTYHNERHPVGAALLQQTLALTALNRGDDRTNALREMMARTMQMDAPRKWYCAMMSGLDIRYHAGEGHPLLGNRMPDPDIVTAGRPTRAFTLLHDTRPALLNLGKPGSLRRAPSSRLPRPRRSASLLLTQTMRSPASPRSSNRSGRRRRMPCWPDRVCRVRPSLLPKDPQCCVLP